MPRDHAKTSLLILFIALMIIMGCGFFLPFSQWGWLGGLFKGLLFILSGLGLYWFHFGEGDLTRYLPTEEDEEYDDIDDYSIAKAEPGSEKSWKGFGPAFSLFQERILSLTQQSLVASRIGFYLIQNGKLIFQLGVSDNKLFTQNFVVPEGDLVSQIISSNDSIIKPLLTEADKLSGYDDIEPHSLIGVPVTIDDECKGVLVAVSETHGHFGDGDIEILSRFAQLAAQVMTICHRGLHWEMDQEVYEVHLHFEKELESCSDEESTCTSFLYHVKQLFPLDRFTFSKNVNGEGEICYVYGQIDQIDQGIRFPLDGGLNGWLIKRNAPLIIQDIEDGRYIRPRYFADEDSKHGMHSFLGIPLKSGQDQAWGCISLESKRPNEYGAKAKEVLEILAIPFQLAYERLHLPNSDNGFDKIIKQNKES
ncbi:GAF domain-containing protein [bacterium]|nr:GAF domain-containing protein [bacterium]